MQLNEDLFQRSTATRHHPSTDRKSDRLTWTHTAPMGFTGWSQRDTLTTGHGHCRDNRRQHTLEVERIVRSLAARGYRLHTFGAKYSVWPGTPTPSPPATQPRGASKAATPAAAPPPTAANPTGLLTALALVRGGGRDWLSFRQVQRRGQLLGGLSGQSASVQVAVRSRLMTVRDPARKSIWWLHPCSRGRISSKVMAP